MDPPTTRSRSPKPLALCIRGSVSCVRQIVANAGLEGSIIVQKVRDGKADYGFNARTEVYENLLRRNQTLVGHHFAIGVEDAVFLRGDLPLAVLTEAELDRALGSLYATTEQCYRSLLRLGFASRFPPAPRRRRQLRVSLPSPRWASACWSSVGRVPPGCHSCAASSTRATP